jgi:hypothetical protein
MLLVYMHEVPDLSSKGGIRRLDRYDQLAEYVFGRSRVHCQNAPPLRLSSASLPVLSPHSLQPQPAPSRQRLPHLLTRPTYVAAKPRPLSAAGKNRGRKILLPFQLAVLLGMSITYVLVGGENLMAFAKAITPAGGASLGKYAYIIMFGCVELFLSMVSRAVL